ncbi:MAG TPA: hypothetical protein VEW74_00910, partial [Candidatus Nitrosotalea sp.]|nr:hypothetical protein [Candidatus Nitrosotalea sp.]
INAAIVRRKNLYGDVRRKRRSLQFSIAQGPQPFVRNIGDVGNERPAHLAGRRDAKAPLRTHLTSTGGPTTQPKREFNLQQRVIALRAHFLQGPSAYPLGFGSGIRQNDLVQRHAFT